MSDNNRSYKKMNLWDILPWVWLGAGVLLMFIYHVGPGKGLVDGDMAGEIMSKIDFLSRRPTSRKYDNTLLAQWRKRMREHENNSKNIRLRGYKK